MLYLIINFKYILWWIKIITRILYEQLLWLFIKQKKYRNLRYWKCINTYEIYI